MFEEVHIKSFNKDTRDSLQEGFNSQPSIDSTSIGNRSRPSAMSTSTLNYDASRGDGTNDGTMIDVMIMLEMIEGMLSNNNKVKIH